MSTINTLCTVDSFINQWLHMEGSWLHIRILIFWYCRYFVLVFASIACIKMDESYTYILNRSINWNSLLDWKLILSSRITAKYMGHQSTLHKEIWQIWANYPSMAIVTWWWIVTSSNWTETVNWFFTSSGNASKYYFQLLSSSSNQSIQHRAAYETLGVEIGK